MNETHTTVVLADDHPVMRHGLREIIDSHPGCRVVDEAESGESALQMVRTKRPDIAVLDIEMPGMSGIDVATQLKQELPDTALIILTMHRETAFFFRAIDAGVNAYVLKDSAIRDILESIDRVCMGEFYITSEMRNLLLEYRLKKRQLRIEHRGMNHLTRTEQKVLKHIAQGMTSREVAEHLCVSPRTVEHHRSSICRKLDLKGNNALLRFALEHQSEF